MKPSRLILFLVIPLLFSCARRVPEVPMAEFPAGPLVQELQQHARSFSTLRTGASLELVGKGRRRSFENAAVLVKGRDRFKIEAYGPLGQTAAELVWNGREVTLDFEGRRRVLPPDAGLEPLLGSGVEPADLADVLAGNVPGLARATSARLRCTETGVCLLDLKSGDTTVRVRPETGPDQARSAPASCDVLRGRSLVYRVRYESFRETAGYLLPTVIVLENPGREVSFTVRYEDPEVNVPLGDGEFEPEGDGE